MPINNSLTPVGQNELGAAFGYYPSMGKRRLQDPIGATEVPLQLVRGRVAGTLGLPSDVLNVVRSPMPMEMFGDVDYSEQKLVPYGTSQLLKELPLPPTSRVGQVAGEIGSIAPMSPAEALQAARVARRAALAGEKAAMAVGKAGERYAERVVPQIMERGGLPAQLLTDLSQGSRRQIFIGENSKSWNKGAEELALKMEKAGNTPEDIWTATGTFRGPEGKLRQEISDKGAKLTLGQGKPDAYGAIEAKTFEGALEHPRLQQAYPQLNEVKFQHWPDEEFQGATFDPSDNVVTMGQKAMQPERGVALHELQHAIQRQEGFAKGGSPSTVLNDWYAGVNSELSSLSKQMDALPDFERRFDKSKQAQYDVLRTKYDDLMSQKLYNAPDADDAYRRLAGEAEARAVQKRMNMSDAERRSTFPYESYDVKPNNLIIKKTDGIAESTNGLRESRKNAPTELPQENALKLAQQRAALPVNEGGLGLNPNNTAAERAEAMRFDLENPQYHATDVDFTSIRPSSRGKMGAGVYTSPNVQYAEKYSAPADRRVLPLVSKGYYADAEKRSSIFDKVIEDAYSKNPNLTSRELHDLVAQEMQNRGYSGFDVDQERLTFNPEDLRSRFAAFDPFRRTAAVAATMGVAAPDLLAQDKNKLKVKK